MGSSFWPIRDGSVRGTMIRERLALWRARGDYTEIVAGRCWIPHLGRRMTILVYDGILLQLGLSLHTYGIGIKIFNLAIWFWF